MHLKFVNELIERIQTPPLVYKVFIFKNNIALFMCAKKQDSYLHSCMYEVLFSKNNSYFKISPSSYFAKNN